MAYLTVFTATYNRAHTLGKVFETLMSQTFRDFEWLIIDDGSSDGTAELVKQFEKDADFKIRYYWKENGGVHTARNYSYPLIKTQYTISMDSDDQFTDDALQKVHDIWESLSGKEKERYWQVSGRCKDSVTGKMIGKPYPDYINKLHGRKQNIARHKCQGEKSCCRRTDVLVKYPFPEFKDVKDITGDYIWEQIDERYDTYCTNEVFRIYENDSPDSMGQGRGHSSTYRRTQWYFSVLMVNKMFSHFFFDYRVPIALVNLPRLTWLSGTSYRELMQTITNPLKKILVLAVTPISYIVMRIHDKHKRAK